MRRKKDDQARWAHKTSLTLPLPLKCIYQASKVTSHVESLLPLFLCCFLKICYCIFL